MKFSSFEKVILIASFMSMLFSIIMWILYPEDLTSIFVGLWVPSILGLGIFIRLHATEDRSSK